MESLITSSIETVITDMLKISLCPYYPIPLALLSFRDSYQMASDILFEDISSYNCFQQITDSIDFKSVLAELGGVPRFVIKFVSIIAERVRNDISCESYDSSYVQTVIILSKIDVYNYVRSRYIVSGFCDELPHIVELAFMITKIDPTNPDYVSLQDSGLLFIEKDL